LRELPRRSWDWNEGGGPLVERRCLWFIRCMRRFKGWVLLVGVLGILAACSTAPITGRRQLSLVSAGQEAQLGLTEFEKLKKDTPVSHDPAANALLQKVGKRIAAATGNDLPNAQWEFVVFESKEANAFCLPGGKIGVYTGIIPLVKDDAGLATVLGHEIAHATLHHGAERMSRAMATQVVGQGLGYAVDTTNPKWTAAFSQLYGVGTGVAIELPYSRSNESEADKMGL